MNEMTLLDVLIEGAKSRDEVVRKYSIAFVAAKLSRTVGERGEWIGIERYDFQYVDAVQWPGVQKTAIRLEWRGAFDNEGNITFSKVVIDDITPIATPGNFPDFDEEECLGQEDMAGLADSIEADLVQRITRAEYHNFIVDLEANATWNLQHPNE